MPKDCPKCKESNVIQAAVCSKCGAKFGGGSDDKELQGKVMLWCVAIAVVLLAWGWIAGMVKGDDFTESDREAAAIVACRNSVSSQLKSPSSADFSGETFTVTGETYRVRGIVDADNSFGAALRRSWTCTAVPVEGTEDYLARATLIE